MKPAVGDVWAGRFRVTGPPLGDGATLAAVAAVDDDTGREVVLRALHDHLLDDPAATARLRALAGVAGRLAHPRVVAVRGLWSEAGRPFLVTDRVDGAPLDRIEGPLAPEAALALGIQVCEALVAAHAADLVHGDLRPGHVLVGSQGAFVCDFGAGSEVPPPMRPGQTAPEVQAGAPPGRASDLYGLGVVMYRALTGELPFRSDAPLGALAVQQRGPETPPGPAGLARLIGDLLHPDPLRRPADARAVLGALRALRRDPARVVRPARRWVAPIRPGRDWVVHGVDPATGGPAVIRGQLPLRRAHRLASRLRDEGWDVTLSHEALGARDLFWVAVLGLVGAMMIPVVGVVVGAALGLVWRTATVQHRIRDVLPAVRAPLPPEAPEGRELPVPAGVSLLIAALCLWLEPWTALVPLGVLMALIVVAVRRPPAAERVALRARVSALLGDLRRGLETGVGDLDRALALQGELEALELSWRAGELADELALARADALERRLAVETDRTAARDRRLDARYRAGTRTER